MVGCGSESYKTLLTVSLLSVVSLIFVVIFVDNMVAVAYLPTLISSLPNTLFGGITNGLGTINDQLGQMNGQLAQLAQITQMNLQLAQMNANLATIIEVLQKAK